MFCWKPGELPLWFSDQVPAIRAVIKHPHRSLLRASARKESKNSNNTIYEQWDLTNAFLYTSFEPPDSAVGRENYEKLQAPPIEVSYVNGRAWVRLQV